MDETAFNYCETCTVDDGSCCYIAGCTDVTAFNYNSLSKKTFLPKTSFPNGTALVPMDQIGWRMITELMEYTSTKDQHYTNSPKDRGQDAWRALESVNYEINNDVCSVIAK